MVQHRQELVRQALEAVAIAREGSYVAPSGRKVDVRAAVSACVAGTVNHRPEEALPLDPPARFTTAVRVVGCTSLDSARRLAHGGHDVLVLNFASAKNPGGGFLSGAVAQEESLARSSALHAAIAPSAMYAQHVHGDGVYTDWMIWSPQVPVFRDDVTGALLEEPYRATILTAAAPTATVVREHQPTRAGELPVVLRRRIERALAIAALHGHTRLVLGAWGCGVFGNDPELVADLFKEELSLRFDGVFDEVVFAVYDRTPDRRNIAPFEARFL